VDRDAHDPSSSRWQPLLREADQLTIAVLITIGFLAILLHWTWHWVAGDSLIEIDQAPPLELPFEVQLNQAEWPELTLLPHIGETLAKRIVEYRQTHGPFQTVDQLQQVKGIGPKTLRRIQPYVRVEAPP
jgi:competence protein ComEA